MAKEFCLESRSASQYKRPNSLELQCGDIYIYLRNFCVGFGIIDKIHEIKPY